MIPKMKGLNRKIAAAFSFLLFPPPWGLAAYQPITTGGHHHHHHHHRLAASQILPLPRANHIASSDSQGFFPLSFLPSPFIRFFFFFFLFFFLVPIGDSDLGIPRQRPRRRRREGEDGVRGAARGGDAAEVQVQRRRPLARRQVHPPALLVTIRQPLPALVPVSAAPPRISFLSFSFLPFHQCFDPCLVKLLAFAKMIASKRNTGTS